MPLKKLMLTGRDPAATPQLDADEAHRIIVDGRGWTNSDRHGAYDRLPTDTLIERLGSWSPIVRERAAIALGRRDDPPIGQLVAMLDAPELETRLGACQALAQLKRRAAPAVPKLIELLQQADALWLRVKAADVLAAIGEPARAAAPIMLERLARPPSAEDPRGMEQRYLCFALFNQRGGLLGKSTEGVNTEQLWSAIHAGLRNQDGRARGSFSNVFRNLPEDQLQALLPELHYSVVHPAPSGIMFADGIRMTGVDILSEFKVEEGIDACMFYLKHQNPWASEKRTPKLLEALRSYGVHAQRTIPDLEKLAADYADGEPGFPNHLSQRKANDVRETIAYLQQVEAKPELMKLP
jgi:hypothetical protein